MLRKLASPRKGSRFAAASPSDGKQLSPLDGNTTAVNHANIQQAAPRSPAGSPKKRMSLWSRNTPATDVPTEADTPSTTKSPEEPLVGAIAMPKEEEKATGDVKPESPRQTPRPLVRSPRRKSIFEDNDAKPTSPKPKPEEKKATRSKRDSLGLKSLVTKREKANPSEEKAGKAVDEVTTTKSTSPKSKERETGSTTKATPEDNVDPALSPIRRVRRSNADGKRLEPSTTTATIHEAASLLNRTAATRPEGVPPMEQPEVHIIGEIVGGNGFGKPSDGFCCKWSVDYGNQWIHIAGDQVGQTQIDYSDASAPDEGSVVWAHPLDLHFATTALHGWPKMLLQVWRVDSHMKMNVVGYGFVHLPFTPGHHQLTVSMWRPMGSSREELAAALLGHTPELASDEILFNTAWAERCRLRTIATGHVSLSIGVIVRNLGSNSIHTNM